MAILKPVDPGAHPEFLLGGRGLTLKLFIIYV
jgi:hypothetical protein